MANNTTTTYTQSLVTPQLGDTFASSFDELVKKIDNNFVILSNLANARCADNVPFVVHVEQIVTKTNDTYALTNTSSQSNGRRIYDALFGDNAFATDDVTSRQTRLAMIYASNNGRIEWSSYKIASSQSTTNAYVDVVLANPFVVVGNEYDSVGNIRQYNRIVVTHYLNEIAYDTSRASNAGANIDVTFVSLSLVPEIGWDATKDDVCWFINNTSTGISCRGLKGDDGKNGNIYLARLINDSTYTNVNNFYWYDASIEGDNDAKFVDASTFFAKFELSDNQMFVAMPQTFTNESTSASKIRFFFVDKVERNPTTNAIDVNGTTVKLMYELPTTMDITSFENAMKNNARLFKRGTFGSDATQVYHEFTSDASGNVAFEPLVSGVSGSYVTSAQFDLSHYDVKLNDATFASLSGSTINVASLSGSTINVDELSCSSIDVDTLIGSSITASTSFTSTGSTTLDASKTIIDATNDVLLSDAIVPVGARVDFMTMSSKTFVKKTSDLTNNLYTIDANSLNISRENFIFNPLMGDSGSGNYSFAELHETNGAHNNNLVSKIDYNVPNGYVVATPNETHEPYFSTNGASSRSAINLTTPISYIVFALSSGDNNTPSFTSSGLYDNVENLMLFSTSSWETSPTSSNRCRVAVSSLTSDASTLLSSAYRNVVRSATGTGYVSYLALGVQPNDGSCYYDCGCYSNAKQITDSLTGVVVKITYPMYQYLTKNAQSLFGGSSFNFGSGHTGLKNTNLKDFDIAIFERRFYKDTTNTTTPTKNGFVFQSGQMTPSAETANDTIANVIVFQQKTTGSLTSTIDLISQYTAKMTEYGSYVSGVVGTRTQYVTGIDLNFAHDDDTTTTLHCDCMPYLANKSGGVTEIKKYSTTTSGAKTHLCDFDYITKIHDVNVLNGYVPSFGERNPMPETMKIMRYK